MEPPEADGGAMREVKSPPLPVGKRYNRWCHRRPLVSNQFDQKTGLLFRGQLKISGRPFAERSFLYARALTGDDGAEFVVFSSVELPRPITLVGGVTLVPCFDGSTIGEGMLNAVVDRMRQFSRFIYDGWVRVDDWEGAGPERAVRRIDEALTTFALVADGSFDWEPKYTYNRGSRGTVELEQTHEVQLRAYSDAISRLGERDRDSFLRSLGWLSQAARVRDPIAEFLFYILAMENLAQHVERGAESGSMLASLRSRDWGSKEHSTERAERARTLIGPVGPATGERELLQVVQAVASQCLDSTRRVIEASIRKVLAGFDDELRLLFEDGNDGPSLIGLRNRIAHGSLDAVSEADRHRIISNLWPVKSIARTYVLGVLSLATGVEVESLTHMGRVNLPLGDWILSPGMQWKGPTEMAALYGI